MAKLRVHNFSVSIDGYAAGPDQDLDNPLGVGGMRLHEWAFATPTFGGEAVGEAGIDEEFAARMNVGIGATIMGRNMFGPIRDDWPDDEWKGWWGDEPPYHHPVFVLTHHRRDPVTMQGGTTFNFVPDGIHSALEQAFDAAEGEDVLVGGGASTVQQYLRAGLIDEMHVAITPLILGDGERLFDNLDGGLEGYSCELTPSASVVHAVFTRA